MTYKEACEKACRWCRSGVPFCCDQHPHGEMRFHRDPAWEHPNTWRTHQMCTAPTLEAWAEQETKRADEAEARADALADALDAIMEQIENGNLVRDVRNDSDPGWAIKQFPLVMSLKAAQEALTAYRAQNAPHPTRSPTGRNDV